MDRKQNTLNRLKTNKSKDIEIATLADKLSNMRSIFKDYEIEKEKL